MAVDFQEGAFQEDKPRRELSYQFSVGITLLMSQWSNQVLWSSAETGRGVQKGVKAKVWFIGDQKCINPPPKEQGAGQAESSQLSVIVNDFAIPEIHCDWGTSSPIIFSAIASYLQTLPKKWVEVVMFLFQDLFSFISIINDWYF